MTLKEKRLVLSAKLKALIGNDHVYFQPNEQSKIEYPCIVYSRDPAYRAHADNIVYRSMQRYEATLIDRDPDSPVYDKLVDFPYCAPTTSFVVDGLYHHVFDLYH